MSSSFILSKPLQAFKLTAVIGTLILGGVGFAGVLPGQNLTGLLVLAFFPFILSVVVGSEALFAGYQLARSDDPVARLTARRGYTGIRVIEVVVTVAAPGIFYVLIVQIGGEVPGPGAFGLLFIGIGLGLLAYGAVLLRTLAEYYYHRRRFSPSRTGDHGGKAVE